MQNSFVINSGKTVSVEVTVNLFKDERLFVAYCPALELSGTGDTKEEAKKDFEAVVQIFIEETQKTGTLEKALLSLGWRLQQTPVAEYEPPKKRKFPYEGVVPIEDFMKHVTLPLSLA